MSLSIFSVFAGEEKKIVSNFAQHNARLGIENPVVGDSRQVQTVELYKQVKESRSETAWQATQLAGGKALESMKELEVLVGRNIEAASKSEKFKK